MGTTLGHVFFIGGTGMLADASRWIACRAAILTLAARNPARLADELKANPVVMDWSNSIAARSALPVKQFDIVISWLHDEAIWLARPIENLLKSGGRSIRIHGAKSLEPANLRQRNPDPRPDVTHQNVILGWKGSIDDKRWLTNTEIRGGVITALTRPNKKTIIVGDARGK